MCVCLYVCVCVWIFSPAELYENLGRMGASLKENLMVGMRNMWESLSEFARSHKSPGAAGLTQGQEQPDTPTEPEPHPQDENGAYNVVYQSVTLAASYIP